MKKGDRLLLSLLFSSLVTVWHVLYFPVRVNSRMVLQPWLLQQGFMPFVHIGDEHAPLLPHLISWFSALFAEDMLLTARVLHGTLIWGIVFSCVWFVFSRAGRWGAVACGAYFLAMSSGLGFWAMWYDLAVAPIFLAAFWVALSDRFALVARIFLIGMVTGIGILVKQHAILIVLLVPFTLLMQPVGNESGWGRWLKAGLSFLAGFFIPVSIYLIYYFSQTNDWYAIWYWMVAFNLVGEYRHLGGKWPTLLEIRAILPAFLLIVPFVWGTVQRSWVKKSARRVAERWLLLLLLGLTAVMLYPRYSTMHWATMLPFLAIASGIAGGELLPASSQNGRLSLPWGVYLAVVGLLWLGTGTLTYLNAYQERDRRALVEYDGLPELASQITSKTSLGSIFLFPDDEGVGNLYYLLQKTPPRFWLMNYAWFRNEYELDRWSTAVRSDPPDQVIYFAARGPQNSPEMNQFILANYQTIQQINWNGQPVEIMERVATE